MPSVPREKYLEMNWRAADKADQVPEERQWALILVAKHTTAGTFLKRQSRIVRRWNRYGMHSKRASNNQLHFGISETLIWQTSDKRSRRQWLTWISTSSRLSGGANGRRKPRRSE